MTLNILNRRLSLAEFRAYVESYNFGTLPANKLVIHHTWRPTIEQWKGERSIIGLKNYYENKGWPAGPHLFVAPDGIWLFSPMRQNGIHAGTLNDRSVGIEIVGDYDQECWTGAIKYNALGVIDVLMKHLKLTPEQIYFHRDVSSKSCPGHSITKEWLFKELDVFRRNPSSALQSSILPQIQQFTAPPPQHLQSELMIPLWATEAVAFVRQHKLFEITDQEDIRDAVKFYRFYQLIRENDGPK